MTSSTENNYIAFGLGPRSPPKDPEMISYIITQYILEKYDIKNMKNLKPHSNNIVIAPFKRVPDDIFSKAINK